MDLNTILNIMAEYNLTAEELLLVYVTYIAREENGNNIAETYARVFTAATPSGMKAGDIWVYNNSIKFYNGTTWILLNSWQ